MWMQKQADNISSGSSCIKNGQKLQIYARICKHYDMTLPGSSKTLFKTTLELYQWRLQILCWLNTYVYYTDNWIFSWYFHTRRNTMPILTITTSMQSQFSIFWNTTMTCIKTTSMRPKWLVSNSGTQLILWAPPTSSRMRQLTSIKRIVMLKWLTFVLLHRVKTFWSGFGWAPKIWLPLSVSFLKKHSANWGPLILQSPPFLTAGRWFDPFAVHVNTCP